VPDPSTPDTWPAADDATIVQRDTLVGAPPPPPPGGPPPDRRIGAGMLLALGALVLVAAGILIAYLLAHDDKSSAPTTTVITTTPSTTVPPKVAVPRFVGMKEQDALVRAGQVGLKPKEVFQPSKKPKGTVISQNPEEGTEVPRNSEVKLVVDSNAKPATTTTPTTTAQTTTAPTTTAATTTAPSTTAAPAQPASATVPDVSGQTEQQAATAFGNAGILASVVFVPGQQSLGTVAAQGKPANSTVPYHSHVQINVSRGPSNNPNESVPNVVGQTLQQAVSTLNGNHLRLIYLKYPVTSPAQAGKVVQQSPLGGGQAPQNAQVIVYLGALKAG
jgi:beta-lactam-binding protein with PASTA domain